MKPLVDQTPDKLNVWTIKNKFKKVSILFIDKSSVILLILGLIMFVWNRLSNLGPLHLLVLKTAQFRRTALSKEKKSPRYAIYEVSSRYQFHLPAPTPNPKLSPIP